MSLIRGIHHISMKCVTQEDYQRVLSFYRDVLGLRVVRQWDNGMMLDTGSGLLEIFRDGQSPLEKGVIRHVALAAGDVDECARRVTQAGYPVFLGPKDIVIPSEPPYRARIAFCHGPLGEEIEFFCPENDGLS